MAASTGEHREQTKSGYVAVIGLPNAGKSTLVNNFLNQKISIVSPKPQTTRNNVTCILTGDDFQIIFIDTPGLLTPKYRMQEVMASFVQTAINESDIILLLIDAAEFRGIHTQLKKIHDSIRNKHIIVALNKVDLIHPKERLLVIIEQIALFYGEVEIVPISAKTGESTRELLDIVIGKLPAGPKLFPEDMVSTETERFFASELIREAVFLTMSEEIPYASGVVIEGFEEKENVTVITASILVEKESQKPIIIGKNGRTIKEIGTKARLGIEEFLGGKVFLELYVKVRKDWRDSDVFLREIGLKR